MHGINLTSLHRRIPNFHDELMRYLRYMEDFYLSPFWEHAAPILSR